MFCYLLQDARLLVSPAGALYQPKSHGVLQTCILFVVFKFYRHILSSETTYLTCIKCTIVRLKMAEIELRIATKEHLPILNRLYADMDNKPLMCDEQIIGIWNEIQEIPNYFVYLAYLNNKAIGTFSLLLMPTMMHRDFHKSAILDSVTIATDYRGQGFGKEMIERALKISANAGCYKVTFSSNLKRKSAHKFYESLGFKKHGWSFSYQLW